MEAAGRVLSHETLAPAVAVRGEAASRVPDGQAGLVGAVGGVAVVRWLGRQRVAAEALEMGFTSSRQSVCAPAGAGRGRSGGAGCSRR
eukprot:14946162-Alexandrium_andersonii.AAC.1